MTHQLFRSGIPSSCTHLFRPPWHVSVPVQQQQQQRPSCSISLHSIQYSTAEHAQSGNYINTSLNKQEALKMGWQPSGGSSAADTEARCGTVRSSMETNVLIAKTQLGKVKKTTFNNLPLDKAYGVVMPPDAEGAKAVISTWKGHEPNPHAKPGPDFMAMNKAAADTGLVSSGQFRTYRAVNPITLRSGVEGVSKPHPPVPSDKDPSFAYGKPAGHRSAEVIRSCGAEEPAMRALMQGGYSSDWVEMNMARKDEFDDRKRYIKPQPTGATEGHALGAQRTIEAAEAASGPPCKQWKMKRFESKAQPKITKYMHGQSGAEELQVHGQDC